MEIKIFNAEMQLAVADFFGKCFSAVGIPYSPKDRHADIATRISGERIWKIVW